MTKKIISLILVLTLVYSFTVIPVSAVSENGDSEWTDLTKNEYPFVFVHGMGGWAAPSVPQRP